MSNQIKIPARLRYKTNVEDAANQVQMFKSFNVTTSEQITSQRRKDITSEENTTPDLATPAVDYEPSVPILKLNLGHRGPGSFTLNQDLNKSTNITGLLSPIREEKLMEMRRSSETGM